MTARDYQTDLRPAPLLLPALQKMEGAAARAGVLAALKAGLTVSGADLAAPAAFTVSDVADDAQRIAERYVRMVAEPVRSDGDAVEHLRQSRLRRWHEQ